MPKTLLERVLATRPRSASRNDLGDLSLAGHPLPPSLRAILAHDDAWLPELTALRIEDVALRAELALERATDGGRAITVDMFEGLSPLYPGRCFVLEEPTVRDDQVQVAFLYAGVANDDGELPVLAYWRPADDAAQIVIEASSVDVWVALRSSIIKSRSGKLPKAYAPLLQRHADLNFNGCWGHAFSETVTEHAPHIEDACEYLIAPAQLPRETVAFIGGDTDDVERVLSPHGPLRRDGEVITVADSLTIDVTTSVPPAKRFRVPCTSPLAVPVIRTLLALPNAYVYVGFPHAEPQFLWMLKKSRRLESADEIAAWLARYDASK